MRQRLAFCLVCGSFCGWKAQGNSNGGQPLDAKQQVLKLESEWVTAEVKHDEATLQRILHNKFLASLVRASLTIKKLSSSTNSRARSTPPYPKL